MNRLFRIAKTEVLEQRRQPAMLFILVLNYVLWCGGFALFFLMFEFVMGYPVTKPMMEQQLKDTGVELQTFLKLAVSGFGSIVFTNMPLFVAIMSGTSVIHDRECGTMPFLMLAPITRFQLLMGKLLGAMRYPLFFHLLFVGPTSLLIGRFELVAPYSAKFGGSVAWWFAYLLGSPASALFVGALGTVISALSKDSRTSMQFTSFFIGLLSLAIGFVLVDGIAEGVGLQLKFIAGCIIAALVTLNVGARLISRDVTA